MSVSSIGDGGSVHNGGTFGKVGFTTILILPYFESFFVGPQVLLGARIGYYACCLPYAYSSLPLTLLNIDMT